MAGFVVLKFGGTSVSSLARWEVIASRVAEIRQDGLVPVVVCSAVSGITNSIERLLDEAEHGDAAERVAEIAAVHQALAEELEVPFAGVQDELGLLRRLATGAQLLGEAGPRVRARALALGEKMSTRLGAAYLVKRGLGATWIDATTALVSQAAPGITDDRRWLQATVGHAADPSLVARLSECEVVVTQGFIARDPHGDTVLLGRGGSDTSATILAARLGAEHCEIWTDVPGMFTANPRQVPGARLLRKLDYEEAQEIATTGAKVLHPRCLAPVRDAGIPLSLRCTAEPGWPGTVIDAGDPGRGPMVQAISQRRGIVLVSMETVGMWQQVGFLADVFEVYQRLGLSVDSVSTSETNVTVTLDPSANPLDGSTLDHLVEALRPYCEATVLPRCASVSLVGRGIRAILHQLSPALALFEEHKVHLMTQAASDLNLTVVVDADQADRLVDRIHGLLFAHRGESDTLGPSWSALQGARTATADPVASWWHHRRAELQALAQQSPVYVYDAAHIRKRARGLVALQSVDRVLYAMKANPNPEVLRLLRQEGLGFETVSQGEVAKVLREVPDIDPSEILFTPNFCDRATVTWALQQGVRLTVDNLHPLVHWPELFAGAEIFLRLDPGKGRGHHDKVRTAGARSKFGISPDQVDEALAAASDAGATVVGLHAHSGSGVLEVSSWQDTAVWLAEVASRVPTVSVLDLGGGLGIPSRPGDAGLDLAALDQALADVKLAHPGLSLWMEPGRYLVAEAGVLLTRVTQRKQKQDRHYVGVDAGMNTLIRPALYGSWHPIEPLNRAAGGAVVVADVVGPICESGDVLGRDRRLPADTGEGDVLVIGQAGAYGACMASQYNERPLPVEVLLDP